MVDFLQNGRSENAVNFNGNFNGSISKSYTAARFMNRFTLLIKDFIIHFQPFMANVSTAQKLIKGAEST